MNGYLFCLGLISDKSKSSLGALGEAGGFGGTSFLLDGFNKSRAYSFRICCALAGNRL